MRQRDLRVGQRVQIKAPWSSFAGAKGTIVEVREPLVLAHGPLVMIRLDGDARAMAFEAVSFAVLVGEQSEPNLTGAE